MGRFVSPVSLLLLLFLVAAAEAEEFGTPLPADLLACRGGLAAAAPRTEMGFWLSGSRRGGNIASSRPDRDLLRAAAERGLEFVRLSPDKWHGANGAFLVGQTDNYVGLAAEDVAVLRQALDWAYESGLPVVLTMYRVPGAPSLALDGSDLSQPLWTSPEKWREAMRFWTDVASAIGGHPALAGYSLLNDPRPERALGYDAPSERDMAEIHALARGTTADINALYRCLADSIRSVDPTTPIFVEPSAAASTEAISFLEPLIDAATLYSVDDYFPFIFTHPAGTTARFAYPGNMDVGGQLLWMDRVAIEDYFAPLAAWSRRNAIPRERIICAEFGVDRLAVGAADYLADTIAILNASGWHWAFYSFREDVWQTMDYELGTTVVDSLPADPVERERALQALRDQGNEFETLWSQFTPLPQHLEPKPALP